MSETILVTGGTGMLGRCLVPTLLHAGHNVRLLGRRRGDPAAEHFSADLAGSPDLRAALGGITTVIHAGSSPWNKMQAVDIEGTRKLLSACGEIRNFVYVSITGVDRIPVAYYKVKHEAERIIGQSKVPYTIVRTTQFHPFVEYLLKKAAVLPYQAKLQPIHLNEAADRIMQAAVGEPKGMMIEAGGPDVFTLGELKEQWEQARGRRKWALPLPVIGRAMRALDEGGATCPNGFRGKVGWKDWLGTQFRSKTIAQL